MTVYIISRQIHDINSSQSTGISIYYKLYRFFLNKYISITCVSPDEYHSFYHDTFHNEKIRGCRNQLFRCNHFLNVYIIAIQMVSLNHTVFNLEFMLPRRNFAKAIKIFVWIFREDYLSGSKRV